VPHAGTRIAEEVVDICRLTERQIVEDGDEGAAEIFSLEQEVAGYVTTDIARAVVDLNRAPNDTRADGVVKTHTIYEIPIYERPLRENEIEVLLRRYYYPYHNRLSQLGKDAILGIDCHTMAAVGPPIGPAAGVERPLICLSNAHSTCSSEWLKRLADCLQEAFRNEVSVNSPFTGGYIIRTHAQELPWMQLELSRASFMSLEDKRHNVLQAITDWCRLHDCGSRVEDRASS
jgi:formiminoglutamase